MNAAKCRGGGNVLAGVVCRTPCDGAQETEALTQNPDPNATVSVQNSGLRDI
jgi:hypothetical protein